MTTYNFYVPDVNGQPGVYAGSLECESLEIAEYIAIQKGLIVMA